jgi:hypothetical protein
MKRRFVLLARHPLTAQQNLITAFIKNSGWGFWHWCSDGWLITTHANLGLDPGILRDKIREVVPGLQVLVVQVEPATGSGWAVYGPTAWGEWLRETWT